MLKNTIFITYANQSLGVIYPKYISDIKNEL